MKGKKQYSNALSNVVLRTMLRIMCAIGVEIRARDLLYIIQYIPATYLCYSVSPCGILAFEIKRKMIFFCRAP